jgi:hypothetical protein
LCRREEEELQGVRLAGAAAAAAWLGWQQQQRPHLVEQRQLQHKQQRQMSSWIVPAVQQQACPIHCRQLHSWLMALQPATVMLLTQQQRLIRHMVAAEQQWQQRRQQRQAL